MCAAPASPNAANSPAAEPGGFKRLGQKIKAGWGKSKHLWALPLPVIVFALLAVLPYALAFTIATEGELHAALVAIGEAFGIAVLLLLAGHFYFEVKLSQESVSRGVRSSMAQIFGFLNPNQPKQLEAAVAEMAREPMYFEYCLWRLTFDWANREEGVVMLTISMHSRGQCIQESGHWVEKPLWTATSVPGRVTDFIKYSLHCPASAINIDEEWTPAQHSPGEENPFRRETPFRLYLDQKEIVRQKASGRPIGYEDWFNCNRASRMFRFAADSISITHSYFEILFRLQLEGDALGDLDVGALHPSRNETQEWSYIDPNRDEQSHDWSNVTPGQATIISWRPRDQQAQGIAGAGGQQASSPDGPETAQGP